MYKKNRKAFTLLEIMVVIALIAIIMTWVSTLNFSSLSNSQKAEILANKIISQIEEARNNILVWKWETNTTTPSWFSNIKSYNITLEKNFFEVKKQKDTAEVTEKKYNFENNEKITNLFCINWTNTTNLWEKMSIKFFPEWICIWKNKNDCNCLSGEIVLEFNWSKKTIIFDSISWLVKQKR